MQYRKSLPKGQEGRDVPPGEEITILVDNKRIGKRLVTFKRTHKKSGFGMWRIISNKPYRESGVVTTPLGGRIRTR